MSDILQLLSEGEELMIGATDGAETLDSRAVSYAACVSVTSDVGLEGNYWKHDRPAEIKPKTPVEVHELVKEVTSFEQMFESLGRPRQDLLLTPAQVKRFCIDHFRWLCRGGHTFFLSEIGGEFIVGCVGLDTASYLKLGLGVTTLSIGGHVWCSRIRDRVVLPQLLPVA
jgi:hypothetical protein